MRACTHNPLHYSCTELYIVCKNVLISHNWMMHAYASCTCNLIVHVQSNICFFTHWLKNPIIQMTSLMHHFNIPRTRMCSPDQCSISCLFTPPLLPVSQYYGLLQQKVPAGDNGYTKCAYNRNHVCSNICITMGLHACQYCIFKVILINTI